MYIRLNGGLGAASAASALRVSDAAGQDAFDALTVGLFGSRGGRARDGLGRCVTSSVLVLWARGQAAVQLGPEPGYSLLQRELRCCALRRRR